MKRQGAFLGILLIGLGTIFALQAADVWPDDVEIWPGILIVVGLAIATDQASRGFRVAWFVPLVLIGLGTFFLLRDLDVVGSGFIAPAVLIVVGLAMLLGRSGRRGIGPVESVSIPLEGAMRAKVRIEHGAGELHIGSLAPGGALLAAGEMGGVEQRVHRSGDRVDVTLRRTAGGWGRAWREDVHLDLSPAVEFELELQTGASKTQLDLVELQVPSLAIKTGASSTEVTTPSRGYTHVTVDAGAASVVVKVPEGVAARISTDTGMATVEVDSTRFPRTGAGYESPGYEAATDRLEEMARSRAQEARSSGREVVLPPMDSRERWIVHNTLKTVSGIRTESVGAGRVKRVKILPA